jgi:hypothetical protein
MQGLVFVAVVWAQAQWTNPYTGHQSNNPISSTLDTIIQGQMQQRMLERSMAARRGQTPPTPAAHVNLAASDFRPAGKGHPTVEAYLNSPTLTPEARKMMRPVFDATFNMLAQTRKNNVATALASAVAIAEGIVSGQQYSAPAAQQLLLGVNDLLAQSPQFTRLKPADKQMMYETLVMTTALMAILQEGGKTNPEMRAQSVSLARSVLQQLTGSATVN